MTSVAPPACERTGVDPSLQDAILRTLAYADVFDYPLRIDEIHRYLIGRAAERSAIEDALDERGALAARVERTGELYHLRGRAGTVARRSRRAGSSASLWRTARVWARVVAALPLVRGVAVSGGLAMDNADGGGDIDLFVIACPARVWLCRALVVAVVRVAALRGHRLCPNFVLAADRPALSGRDVFVAHEIAQLVPVAPTRDYETFWAANEWIREFLPNARASRAAISPPPRRPLATPLERVVAGRLFGPLERWERRRKIARLEARARREGGRVAFSADECRGHFGGHDARVLREFASRCRLLGLP